VYGLIVIKKGLSIALELSWVLRFFQGLPDFSRNNIPKWEKYTKWPQNIPNVHRIYQIAVNIQNGHKIYLPVKLYPNWDFWYANTYTIWQPWFPQMWETQSPNYVLLRVTCKKERKKTFLFSLSFGRYMWQRSECPNNFGKSVSKSNLFDAPLNQWRNLFLQNQLIVSQVISSILFRAFLQNCNCETRCFQTRAEPRPKI
jgi:hypothetical protein